MYKRQIWHAKVYSRKTKGSNKKNPTIIEFEENTSVIGSSFEEVMGLTTEPSRRIKGTIYKIDFLTYLSKTNYKI